jgi:hypothetical protein
LYSATLHIMSWREVEFSSQASSYVIRAAGRYGPFRYSGHFTTEQRRLRSFLRRDASSGSMIYAIVRWRRHST